MASSERLVKCEGCGEPLAARGRDFGRTVVCPGCGANFYLPENPELTMRAGTPSEGTRRVLNQEQQILQAAPLQTPSTPTAKGRNGPAVAGAVCLVLGCVTMLILPLAPLIYAWAFIAAFILSIVAISQGRLGQGLGVLLGTIILPAIIFALQVVLVFGGLASLVSQAFELTDASSAPRPRTHQPRSKPPGPSRSPSSTPRQLRCDYARRLPNVLESSGWQGRNPGS